MSDFEICAGCGDYPTNELNNYRPIIIDEDYEKHLREIGMQQDSTGCWYDPKDPHIYDLDY